jgi:hypothetical protein
VTTAGHPTGAGAGLPDAPPGARILLAEDDADLRRVLAFGLRPAGYAVLAAADGRRPGGAPHRGLTCAV